MKKAFMIGAAALFLTACGDKEATTTTEKTTTPVEQKEEKAEVKVEVTDKAFYTWEDPSIGDIPQFVTYAVIENTGNTTVDVNETKVTYLDNKGDIIKVTPANQMYTNVSPSIIAPGDVAYLAIAEDVGAEFKDLDDVDIEVTPYAFEGEINKLEAEQEKVVKTDDWGGSVSVTGFLNNKGDQAVSHVEASAGLYDKEDNFLGVLLLSSDDTTTVQPKDKSSIEVGFSKFPNTEVEKVDHAKIEAIGFTAE